MLEMKRSPWARAASMRLMCPACRLPMVGTNTTRSCASCQRATCARTSAMDVTVCMRHRSGDARRSCMEFMFRPRVGLALHGLDVLLQGVEIRTGAVHEILHEARLAARGDVEHVVQHQDLAVGVGPGADADHRHFERLGDALA